MLRKVAMVCVVVMLVTVLAGVAGCTSANPSNPSTASAPTAQSTTTPTQTTPTTAALPAAPTTNIQSYTGPFVGSKNSNVYHYPWCYEAKKILPKNLVTFATVADACAAGYRPCEVCNPPACNPTPTPAPTYEVQISGSVINNTGHFYATVTNSAGVYQTLNWQINWFLNGQLAGGTLDTKRRHHSPIDSRSPIHRHCNLLNTSTVAERWLNVSNQRTVLCDRLKEELPAHFLYWRH